MAKHRYKVLRRLIGDQTYEEGDERIAAPADVAHLVGRSLEDLGPVKEEAKAEEEPLNKAEGASPSNKAAPKARKAKGATE